MTRRTGRPSKLTPSVIAKLEVAVEAGASRRDQAGFASISVRALSDWLKRGNDERDAGVARSKSRHVELVERLDRAQARCNVLDLQALGRHGRSDPRAWRALAHRLAMRDPANYSPARKLELAGKGGGPIVFYYPKPEPPDGEPSESASDAHPPQLPATTAADDDHRAAAQLAAPTNDQEPETSR